MNKASITYVKTALSGRKPKKRFGQNFLIDANIANKIVSIASNKNINTIEIGPGLGSLTEFLVNNSKHLEVYEIDRDLCNELEKEFPDIKVNNCDFLEVDLSIYGNTLINVVSNLPYYITTPILFKIINSSLNINKITVMVQKEVADRLTASVGSKDYNALSIIINYLFEVEYEFTVKKSCFYPSPLVDSAVVSFVPKIKRDKLYEEKLFNIIENSFRMRRKTLYNNLKTIFSNELLKEIFDKLNFDSTIRAEELTLNDYINIYKVIYEK